MRKSVRLPNGMKYYPDDSMNIEAFKTYLSRGYIVDKLGPRGYFFMPLDLYLAGNRAWVFLDYTEKKAFNKLEGLSEQYEELNEAKSVAGIVAYIIAGLNKEFGEEPEESPESECSGKCEHCTCGSHDLPEYGDVFSEDRLDPNTLENLATAQRSLLGILSDGATVTLRQTPEGHVSIFCTKDTRLISITQDNLFHSLLVTESVVMDWTTEDTKKTLSEEE